MTPAHPPAPSHTVTTAAPDWPRRVLRLLVPLALAMAVLALGARSALAGPPPGFELRPVVTGLNQPVAVAFAPDGRIFIAEKRGVLRVTDGTSTSTILNIATQVNSASDRGLLGLALDPGFAVNRYVYLLYTRELHPDDRDRSSLPAGGELVRVQMSASNPNALDMATWTVLLDGFQSDGSSHSVGSLRFDGDGRLLASFGDGSDYADVDPRALRSYDLDLLNGKIVRIDPATGRGVPGNPYYSALAPNSVRSKVIGRGFRNPSRFVPDPETDVIYVGDVGWGSWEEYDVIPATWTNADRQLNFGWPCYEGQAGVSAKQPGYAADPETAGACAALYTPAEGGTGIGAQPAVHAYHRSEPPSAYKADGGNGQAAIGGPRYTGTDYPAAFRGKVFFADYARDRFQVYQPGGGVTNFGTPGGWGNPVDVVIGPSGNVVYVSISEGEVREIVATEAPPPAVGSRSLSFDGSGDAARDTSPAGLPAATPFTVSAWFKADPTSQARHLVQHGTNVAPKSGWGLRRLADGRIAFAHHGRAASTFSPVTPTGQWVFVAVVSSATETRLHTWDASSGWRTASLAALPALIAPAAPLSVGDGFDSGATSFDGLIDDVRIWRSARSAAQITGDHDVTLAGSESGLAGYWRLDEGAGAAAGDSTSAGNDLAFVGGTAWSTDSPISEDAVPPRILSRQPVPGAAAVSRDATVVATFDEVLDPATVTASSVLLEPVAGGPPVPASVQLDAAGGQVTLTPAALLAADTQYRARITTAVADLAGNPLATEASWTFWVNAAPELALLSPSQGQPYEVGETIDVALSADDPEDGPLGGASVTWQVIQHHTGHLHYGAIIDGETGSFDIEDHGDDSYLEVVATATDSRGATTRASAVLNATVAPVTITSSPPGVTVVVNGEEHVTPRSWSSIVNGAHTVVAPPTVTVGGVPRSFVRWDDGGAGGTDPQYLWTTRPAGLSLTAVYDVPPDGDPPTVASRYPAPGAQAVAVGDDLSVTFSEAIAPATITATTVTLTGPGGAVTAARSLSAGGTQLTIDPGAPLAPATTYTVALTGGITDASGNALAGAPITWSFTTATTAPPGGSGAYLPVGGTVAMEAENADQVVARSGAGWSPGGPAGSVDEAVTALPNAGQTWGTVPDAATQAPELRFVVDFATAGTYRVWLRANAPDTAGNSLHVGIDGQLTATGDALTSTTYGQWVWYAGSAGGPNPATVTVPTAGLHTISVWAREDGIALDRIVLSTGTTAPIGTGPAESPRDDGGAPDTTPPVLTGRSPAPNATGVAVGTVVSATFDEALAPASLTATSFVLAPTAGGAAIPATRALGSGGTVATLDPSADLAPGTQYTATVTTTVEDVAGNNLPAPISWTFTTAPAAPPPGPGAYLPVNGQVVIEAEGFSAATPRSGDAWTPGQSPAGFVGSALQVAPDNGSGWLDAPATTAPQIDIPIDFSASGTWYVWVRGYSPDTAGNSLHLGLDGATQSASTFLNQYTYGAWLWFNTRSGTPTARITVPSAGVHTLNVWGREDGFHLDRLVLTTSATFVPAGAGPAESARAPG